MKYEELVHFLERQMSMSHVYQPLLVRALVDSGGNATLPQLAQVFLTQDESQLLYYEKRIREIPLKAHKRHGVIVADGQIMSLTAYPMTGEVMPAAFHVQEGKRYRIHMRNAQFGLPLSEARIAAIFRGDIEPVRFDYQRAGLAV